MSLMDILYNVSIALFDGLIIIIAAVFVAAIFGDVLK